MIVSRQVWRQFKTGYTEKTSKQMDKDKTKLMVEDKKVHQVIWLGETFGRYNIIHGCIKKFYNLVPVQTEGATNEKFY